MGRKPKFTEADIESLCEQIAEAVGKGTELYSIYHDQLKLSTTTWYEYLKKYPKLADAIDAGRARAIEVIQSAMFVSGTGYFKEEEKTVARKDKHGEKVVSFERTKKWFPPNIEAAKTWLRNHDPEYRDTDGKTADLRREEYELRRAIAEANNIDLGE